MLEERGGRKLAPDVGAADRKSRQMEENQKKWFATRAIRDKAYVIRFLDYERVPHEGIADLKTLIFVHCTDKEIQNIRYELSDKLLVYRDAEKKHPQPIPDQVMKTFLIMAPFHDEPVMYLSVDNPDFFNGKHKRVVSGVFRGCEGIIKRIKGERRLVVKINDRAAIATPYIPKEFLEDVE